mgnify:CR=1 FL=1
MIFTKRLPKHPNCLIKKWRGHALLQLRNNGNSIRGKEKNADLIIGSGQFNYAIA